jgi:hypothetical protein
MTFHAQYLAVGRRIGGEGIDNSGLPATRRDIVPFFPAQ